MKVATSYPRDHAEAARLARFLATHGHAVRIVGDVRPRVEVAGLTADALTSLVWGYYRGVFEAGCGLCGKERPR